MSDAVTSEVTKAFDTYYSKHVWDEINHGQPPAAKKAKVELEAFAAGAQTKLDVDEAVALAVATVDYFIFNSDDDVLGYSPSHTAFVQKIHEMAKAFKAQHWTRQGPAQAWFSRPGKP
jgi:hypothetical protein